MHKNLVIVESPAKAKTIERFLGKDFLVKSSMGHIRDLEKKDFGIDIQNSFKPKYIISPDKKKIVTDLKKLASEAEVVWLASDEDREGEAIAWHLQEVLKISPEKTKRIVFHEITKEAILDAINNPRSLDTNLVNAQQARRVLDRIVGFEVSPVLWKKVKPALSAGRVQSVAVRLIVEREREIRDFKSVSSFRVNAIFLVNDNDGNISELKAELSKRFDKKEDAVAFLEKCKNADFTVSDVVKKPGKRSPAQPFTTSTLQQEASRKLGFSVSQTMSVAQRLYEAGKITYMRTDSVNLSNLALNTAKKKITEMLGEKYVKTRKYKTKSKSAQEAHEAIRPSYIDQEIVDGSAQEKKLYDLIWKRTIASQMQDAILERTTITINISAATEKFLATGEVLIFDGFLKVYMEGTDDENGNGKGQGLLPPIKTGDSLNSSEISANERFTLKPPRYTEASLVKKLEELGIGRPSTYAPTITTIQNRGYVVKEDREGIIRNYTGLFLKKGVIKEKALTENTGAEKNKMFPTDIG
ncbi:MAG: type I DNA topoisomerase, partial [Mariniphaga sp.]|nr:type I DNA topoisomerase [Mariniphaga sp.]